MQNKFFALIIAASIIAQPIAAQEGEKNQEQPTQRADYKKGLISGALASCAASCFLFGSYIATTAQNGIYIPKWIFKPAGLKQAFIPKTGSHGNELQAVSMPQYSKEKNPLYDWFLAETSMPQEQFSILKPNLANTIAITCAATAFGAFMYWIYHTHKAADKTEKPNAETAA